MKNKQAVNNNNKKYLALLFYNMPQRLSVNLMSFNQNIDIVKNLQGQFYFLSNIHKNLKNL